MCLLLYSKYSLAAATPPVWIKPVFFNKPLVTYSKPASIRPEPVAFTNRVPVSMSGLANTSSSYLLPAVEAAKSAKPPGIIAAINEGAEAKNPSTVL